ncbi:MAG: AAA family ATPase [Halanaerobiales bacterium]|nr:AAA family ATPase [Halanaerobiales bacterium]
MRYKDIYIRDFGIFANAELKNLNPHFNIIGGGNRAGKTSFLKVLRYLGYGFPNKDIIPPARNSYNVEAIMTDGNNDYNILINGYANPQVNILNNRKDEIENIFADIDQFTYNQLFTITLEELKKIPTGVDDKEKLQSVLMGAGLKEYTLIPKLKEYFKTQASNIGGKSGKINVYDFKEYNQIIEEGIKLKKEAKSQVKKYYNLKNEKKEIIDKIAGYKQKLNKKKKKKNRLDLIKSNYKKIEERIQLKEEINKDKYNDIPIEKNNFYPDRALVLYKSYEEINEEFTELLSQFEEYTGEQYKNEIEKTILQQKNQIEKYNNIKSGLKERYKNLKEEDNSLNTKHTNLKKEAATLSNDISENLDRLLEIDTDIEYKNKLRMLVDEYETLINKITNKNEKINELEHKMDAKKEQLREISDQDEISNKSKKYIAILIIYTIIVTSLLFIDWKFSGLYILDIILFYKYYFTKSRSEEKIRKKKNIKDNIEELANNKSLIEQDLEKTFKEKEKIEIKFNELKDHLNLGEEIQPKLLKDYYEDVIELKNKYIEYKRRKERFKNKKEKFENELKRINNFLNNFDNILHYPNYNNKNIIENTDNIIKYIEKLNEIYKIIKKIKNKNSRRKEIRTEINNLKGMEYIGDKNDNLYTKVKEYEKLAKLSNEYNKKRERIKDIEGQLTNITEQMKNAFELKENIEQKEMISVFIDEYSKYVSFQHITEVYETVKDELEDLNKKLDNAKNKKEEINLNMNKLATEEKLIKAENKINRARKNLKPLAEKYAKNRIASYLLENYWQKFLNEKKDKLLGKASEILHKITSGEYSKIEPLDSLTEPNFKVHLREGEIFNEIDHLSRGTREQLYMAIRINRIMEIKPSLPVIIDDSLVNFDPNHLRNIFKIINNLKNSNQIFFLTCHPEQIKYLDEQIDKKSFYSLENGTFEAVQKDELIDRLK